MTARRTGWLRLPAQPRVVYDRTPLALALCQIRFPTMLNVSNPGTVAPFQAAIQDDFPLTTSMAQQVLGMTFNLQGGQLAGMQSQGPSALWRFGDVADDWTVVLSSDFISLETRAYRGFEDFQSRLRRVVDALVATIRPKVCTRIGLRYINELRPGHTDWSAVVRSELLGPMAVPALSECAADWDQHILLKGPEGEKVNIHHGVIASGTTVEPRAGDERPGGEAFYLVDLDAFREFARPELPELTFTGLCKHIQSAHDTVSQFFRWAITESYTETLGVCDDASH